MSLAVLMQRALIADKHQQPDRALSLLSEATDLAHAAGGNRIVAEIALNAARIQRERNQLATAEQTLRDAIEVARSMKERLLLPKLLAQLADLRSSRGKLDEAGGLLAEASEILEGFFTTTSSPWVQSRLITGMDDGFVARIRLEASNKDVGRMFSVVEEARGRSLLELLVNRPLSSQQKPQELRAGERRIVALQRQLLMTNDRSARVGCWTRFSPPKNNSGLYPRHSSTGLGERDPKDRCRLSTTTMPSQGLACSSDPVSLTWNRCGVRRRFK